MDAITTDTFINMFSADSDSHLLGDFDVFNSDEAKLAAACLLMASESNERKA